MYEFLLLVIAWVIALVSFFGYKGSKKPWSLIIINIIILGLFALVIALVSPLTNEVEVDFIFNLYIPAIFGLFIFSVAGLIMEIRLQKKNARPVLHALWSTSSVALISMLFPFVMMFSFLVA